jgi:hypothetical protein
MIVRISTEGQYRLDEAVAERLNVIDNEAVAAVEAGDEAQFLSLFRQMLGLIRSKGALLPEDELHGSDVIVPPPDTTFEEARHEFTGDGLIPD